MAAEAAPENKLDSESRVCERGRERYNKLFGFGLPPMGEQKWEKLPTSCMGVWLVGM